MSVDLYSIVPSKAKAWVGLLGSLLTLVIPFVVDIQNLLPPPWPGVIGGVIAALTFLGIYKAPYVPPGAILAPHTTAVVEAAAEVGPTLPPATPSNPIPPAGGYRNPWRN